ncbi:hypothetical protein QYS48_03030 [Marivirga arenosa]|uniref:SGNH/GDSL hydrolase family protein n=1 Tax=Marivirga arenosa TaxID=3059076 RepID=A0AA49JE09_9BACT|nr:hypothetical protein [Marivirga sp. ABR2-2]WKK86017.2 hypothetical protein QYS48_03030 [Marivirga sp. ABR2-2]
MDLRKNPSFIFSFKLVVFILLIVLISYFISDFIVPKSDERLDVSFKELRNETKDGTNYDVLFFSNSHVFTAIDPLLLENLTGIKSLHLGSSAQRTLFTIETIKAALEIHKPKVVVLDFSQNATFIPKEEEVWSFNTKGFLSIEPNLSKLRTMLEVIPHAEKPDYLINGFSGYFYALNNLNKWKNYTTKEPEAFSRGYLGFRPAASSLYEKDTSHATWNDAYMNFNCNKEYKFFDDNVTKDYLIEFLKEYDEIGVKIVLVSSLKLYSCTEANVVKEFSEITEGTNKENIKLLNLNTPKVKKELNFNRRHYANSTHLSKFGAFELTEYLAPYFSSLVGNIRNQNSCLKYRKGLNIHSFQLQLDDYFNKVLHLYFDSIPSDYLEYNTVINVYPKPGLEYKLMNQDKKSDNTYMEVKDFKKIRKGFVADIYLDTKLMNDEIEKIDLWFYKPNSFGSGRHTIYIAKD